MQPFTTPQVGYSISAQTTLPVVEFADKPAEITMNGERLYRYDSMGLNPFQILQGNIRAYGIDPLMLPAHFAGAGLDWMNTIQPMNSYVGYRSIGRDINLRPKVVSCGSADGANLASLTLVIATEGGAGIRIFSRGHQVHTESGAAFIVRSESLNSDGFQELVLAPIKADQQIIVQSGISRDAPNGSYIVAMGHGERGSGSPEDCDDDYNQVLVQPELVKTCSMTRLNMYHTLYKRDLQNDIANGNFSKFYLNMYNLPGFESTGGAAIAGVFLNHDRQEKIRFYSQVGAYMLYGKEVETEEGVTMGNGIVENISPRNTIRYAGSKQLTADMFRYVLDNSYALLNRGYGISADSPIVALCGSKAYEAIMYNLNVARQVRYEEDPYRMSANMGTAREGYLSADRIYSDLVTVLGVWVRFVKFIPMDARYLTPLNHPENPNIGIYSGDIILLPAGTVAPATRIEDPNLRSFEAPGAKMVNFYSAKDHMSGTADFVTTQYLEKGLRRDGSTAQGEVVAFGDVLKTKHMITFAAELADPLAGVRITMT